MLDFERLRDANVRRNVEWNNGVQPVNLAFRGLELAGEAGEAGNVIKKLERERYGIRGSRATLSDLAEELADVMIAADLIAMDMNIDMSRAVADKFNKTSEKYNLKTRLDD